MLDGDGRVLVVMPEADARAQGLPFEEAAFVLVDRRGRCLAGLDGEGRADFLGRVPVRPGESAEDAVLATAGALAARRLAIRRHEAVRPCPATGGLQVVPFTIEVPVPVLEAESRGTQGREGRRCLAMEWMRLVATHGRPDGEETAPQDEGSDGGEAGPEAGAPCPLAPGLACAIALGLFGEGSPAPRGRRGRTGAATKAARGR